MTDDEQAARDFTYNLRRGPDNLSWGHISEAFLAGIAYARAKAAQLLLTGRFCRRVDHIQGACDCEDIADAIRRGPTPAPSAPGEL